MPRKIMASTNSQFVRLRQNENGNIVVLPDFRNKSLNGFKNIVANSIKASGPEYAVGLEFNGTDFIASLAFQQDKLTNFRQLAQVTGERYVITKNYP
jgi:hypothetical protein